MSVSAITELDTRRVMITQKDYNKVKIKRIGTTVAEVKQILPFRVRFKDLGYPGYSPISGAPIGIAIVGVNNYIL
jgi:hypothetical protein